MKQNSSSANSSVSTVVSNLKPTRQRADGQDGKRLQIEKTRLHRDYGWFSLRKFNICLLVFFKHFLHYKGT